jgi:guanylate kinase
MTTPPTTPLLVIIGPSGSGKSALVRHLAGLELLTVHPTWTTRPRRPDERFGSIEHRFVDPATFEVLADAGFFLDTVELFGLPHRYGLRPIWPSDGDRLDTVMLRAPLVERFRRLVDRPTYVVAVEDDPARLEARLVARGTTGEELRHRLADNDLEVRLGRSVADLVVVNDRTVADAAAAVLAGLRRHAGSTTEVAA